MPDSISKKGVMPLTPLYRQYLSSNDMTMLERVLRKACEANSIADESADALRMAAVLIRAFQQGVREETGLMTTFVSEGGSELVKPLSRSSLLIRAALGRWEDDGGAPANRPAIVRPDP